MGLREIEKLNPRIAAEVGEVVKEIEEPEPPKNVEYPEIWYSSREQLRESGEPVTESAVLKLYKENLESVTAKHASFVGNEVIPELDMLKARMNIDLNDRDKVVAELQSVGLYSIASYLKMLSPEAYEGLCRHVKTSKKADFYAKPEWDRVRVRDTGEWGKIVDVMGGMYRILLEDGKVQNFRPEQVRVGRRSKRRNIIRLLVSKNRKLR